MRLAILFCCYIKYKHASSFKGSISLRWRLGFHFFHIRLFPLLFLKNLTEKSEFGTLLG